MSTDNGGFAIGVDLGATKAEIDLVDETGCIADSGRLETQSADSPEQLVQALATFIQKRFLSDSTRRIIGIGIGVAGQVTPHTGIVRSAPNLNWKNFPLRDRAETALQMPVVVANDVQAIAYGEWQYGAAREANDLVCIFFGTGVGGGVVSGGNFLTGSSGTAGEVGHIIIEDNGPKCTCGSRGCLEAFTGGWAIARRARMAASNRESGKGLIDAAGGDPSAIDGEIVAEALKANDPLARELVEETGRYIGMGLTSIVNAFNPEILVLGGGVLEGMPVLVEIAERELRSRALKAALEPLRVTRSKLGADAGALGMAARLRHSLDGAQASTDGPDHKC